MKNKLYATISHLQGLKFEVIPSTFEETLDKLSFDNPAHYALETARQKTLQVVEMLKQTRVSFF